MQSKHPPHLLVAQLVALLVASAAPVWTTAVQAQQVFPLWPDAPPTTNGLAGAETSNDFGCVGNISEPTLTVYPAPVAYRHTIADSSGVADNKHAAVLVIPGGGYRMVCMQHEGEAVAEWLNALGITAAVLKYRLPNGSYAVPGQDAQQALRWLRRNADDLGFSSERVGVLGFSAGGHLASTVGTHFDVDFSDGQGDNLDQSNRPDFMILVYPVITMKERYGHRGSRIALVGSDPRWPIIERFSNEEQVMAATPPAFLVHAGNDASVHVSNSIAFYQALIAAGVPSEMHIFEAGGHGFALQPGPADGWPGLAASWLERLFTSDD